jgi:non-ribosomal peptide synthetase component F
MIATLATLATLTRPQTDALIAALVGYFTGSLAFKADLGKTKPEIESMIESWAAIMAGKRTWTKWETELVSLLPVMPYTVPEGARDRGTYLRALHRAGLIQEPTMIALESNRASCSETDAKVKKILA